MPIRRRPPTVTSLTRFPERSPRRRRVAIACLAAGALLVAGGGGAAAAALTFAGHPVTASAVTPATGAATPSTGAPAVDTTGFPKGEVGIFTDRCTPVTTAANDPIMMPGKSGASMQHDFFGNEATTASSTTAQLVGGRTSCSTTADASAYWTPVLYQDGHAMKPSAALIYWKAPSNVAHSVQTVPAGLTMIAGNEGASQPQGTDVIAWHCSTPSGTTHADPQTASPHDCPTGTLLRLVVFFPTCWDGHTLNGASQQNVVYPSSPGAACPASHPVRIPQVVFHANYPTRSAAGLTLSIGPDAQGPVTTEHADFMNGWTEPTLTADVAACTAAGIECGPVRGATATPQGGRSPQDGSTTKGSTKGSAKKGSATSGSGAAGRRDGTRMHMKHAGANA